MALCSPDYQQQQLLQVLKAVIMAPLAGLSLPRRLWTAALFDLTLLSPSVHKDHVLKCGGCCGRVHAHSAGRAQRGKLAWRKHSQRKRERERERERKRSSGRGEERREESAAALPVSAAAVNSSRQLFGSHALWKEATTPTTSQKASAPSQERTCVLHIAVNSLFLDSCNTSKNEGTQHRRTTL